MAPGESVLRRAVGSARQAARTTMTEGNSLGSRGRHPRPARVRPTHSTASSNAVIWLLAMHIPRLGGDHSLLVAPRKLISGLLNRLGKKTGKGNRWTQGRVCSYCSAILSTHHSFSIQMTIRNSSQMKPDEEYWAACADRIERFVDASYRWPGVYALHRSALGLDLLKAPLNVLFAVPALAVQVVARALRRANPNTKRHKLADKLLSVPLGLPTAVEGALVERLRAEVLALEGPGRDDWERRVGRASFDPEREAANTVIKRYAETRRASADVATALVVGILGVVLAGQFTPGSISAGHELAANASHYAAARDFFLGPTLGGWFYRLFPPETGLWTEIVSMLVVALLMSLVSAFSGLLADPVQARLGLHQARLRGMLKALRRLGEGPGRDDYRPRDPYMARIVDVVDALKALIP